jgi:hypothetical protein
LAGCVSRYTQAIDHQIVLPTLQHFGVPLALAIYVDVSKTYSSSDSKQQEMQELKLPSVLSMYSQFTILFDRMQ